MDKHLAIFIFFMNFALGKKLNMSQYFDQVSGQSIPVTVVKLSPMVVTQVKETAGKDKYSAIQVGIGKKNKLSKSLKGHLKDLGSFSVLREFKVKDAAVFTKGQKLETLSFAPGDLVNVLGTSKGRGFAGVIKRHGFAGFPASHGHDKPRSVGSIGQRWPQHVRKGMRMAGHMGNIGSTVKNLQVVEYDAKRNLLTLKGAVPGHRNAEIKIVGTGKNKPLVRLQEFKEPKKK